MRPDLDAIAARADAATAGPWMLGKWTPERSPSGYLMICDPIGTPDGQVWISPPFDDETDDEDDDWEGRTAEQNAAFISAARTDVPALLAYIAELEAKVMKPSVTLAEIEEQAAKGWPDFHPETYCNRCGGRNLSWFVDSDRFNLAFGPVGEHPFHGIVCPGCFVEAHEAVTGLTTIWQLVPWTSGFKPSLPDRWWLSDEERR